MRIQKINLKSKPKFIRILGAYGTVVTMLLVYSVIARLSEDNYLEFDLFAFLWPLLPIVSIGYICLGFDCYRSFENMVLFTLACYSLFFFLLLIKWERIIDTFKNDS